MGFLYNRSGNYFEQTEKTVGVLPQIVWHITDRCLYNCMYCFATKMDGEVNISEIEKYGERFKLLGVQKIDISGGEPLLYRQLPELCSYLYNMGIGLTITTRGVGIHENVNWLIENRNMFTRIICSLDLADNDLQDIVCSHKDSIKPIEFIISALQENGYRNYRINTVITKYLIEDKAIYNLINKVTSYLCSEWCIVQPHPANKKDFFDDITVTEQRYEDILNKIKKAYKGTILSREISNYAGYWVLYPNRYFTQHSTTEKDIEGSDFLQEPMKNIEEKVGGKKQWLQITGFE